MNRGTSDGSETLILEGLTSQIGFFRVYLLLFIRYLESYFEKEANIGHTKIDPEDQDSPRRFRTWSRICHRPFFGN